MNNPKISIIVPVYNSEKYLHRCINSILNQTFNNFELLLIDDGSTDRSSQFCDEYARLDERIHVFHKRNGGVSSARQTGIEKAKGKYSIHVDSDDWINPDMLEDMYTNISTNNSDILITDFFIDTNKETKYSKQKPKNIHPLNVLTDILTNCLFGSLWNKLIRHSILAKYNIKFISRIDYCEDVLIWCQLLQKNVTISYLNKAFYHYNLANTNSITRNYTKETYLIRKAYLLKLSSLLPESFCNIINQVVAYDIKKEAFFHQVISKKEFYNFMPIKISTILKVKGGAKNKFFMLLVSLGYFDLACFIYHSLKKIRCSRLLNII